MDAASLYNTLRNKLLPNALPAPTRENKLESVLEKPKVLADRNAYKAYVIQPQTNGEQPLTFEQWAAQQVK